MEKRELFLQKIELEYKLFRRKMLMKGKKLYSGSRKESRVHEGPV